VQLTVPIAEAYLPAGQLKQLEAPALEYLPTAQLVQVLEAAAPVMAE
jgi:hypothetical protein